MRFAKAASIFLAVWQTLLCACFPADAADSNAAWYLSQKGDVSGPHKTLITKTGMRCENVKAGIIIASKAPSWNVIVCNRKTKTYCVVPFAKFHGEMTDKLFGTDRADLQATQWKLDGLTEHLGHKLYRYKMLPYSKPKTKTGAGAGAGRTPFFVEGTYWTFKNIDTPLQNQELLSKIFQLPPQVKGLPFRLLVIDETKGWFESINTVSIVHPKDSVVSIEPPKGFTESKIEGS
jgi:hypothetical protein